MSGLVLSENTKKTLFAVVVIIALGLRWTFFIYTISLVEMGVIVTRLKVCYKQ